MASPSPPCGCLSSPATATQSRSHSRRRPDARADPADRPYLLNSWAIALESAAHRRATLALYREALKLARFLDRLRQRRNSLINIGDEEGACASAKSY
jgi:hypothetical protein